MHNKVSKIRFSFRSPWNAKKNYVHSFFKNGSQSSFNQFNNKLMNKVVLKIRNNFLEIQFGGQIVSINKICKGVFIQGSMPKIDFFTQTLGTITPLRFYTAVKLPGIERSCLV